MTLPAIFPDWVPGWIQLALVIVAILLGLAFLLMPFSVFGVKARLEAVEIRLDEIQAEIRSLSMRLPERVPDRATPALEREDFAGRPPIPPARAEVYQRSARETREEPRFR